MHDPTSLPLLLATTVVIAAGHTAIGVDHTLPFVALGRARAWSLRRTLLVTALCGLGHVASSVALGAIAIAIGLAALRVELLQALRGSLAAWALMAFGAFFVVRATWRGLRGRRHAHEHGHADGVVHSHDHDHGEAPHVHPHPRAGMAAGSVWALFVIFVLGPCEPLIPLLLAPSALGDWGAVVLVAVAFTAVTIAVMVALVAAGHFGASRLRLAGLERHAELLAGLAIATSGAAVQWLGL